MNQTNLERMVSDAITKEYITKEYGDRIIMTMINKKSSDNMNETSYIQVPTKITKFSDFRKKFFEKLEEKTGWGKEQRKKAFDDVYFEVSNENIN